MALNDDRGPDIRYKDVNLPVKEILLANMTVVRSFCIQNGSLYAGETASLY